MCRKTRAVMACLLVLATLTMTPLGMPETALAGDAVVSECTEASFDTALAAVQASGGGTLIVDCSDPIVFTSQKMITSNVTIAGDGAIFDGGSNTRLFQVAPGARLALIGLTLRNGSAGAGGAIHSRGILEVTASTFSGNTAHFGGAIRNEGAGNQVKIVAGTFIDNSSTASPGFGGAIDSFGQLEISASTFSGNSASNNGFGGAVVVGSGEATVTSSSFSGNSASRGGAIYIEESSEADSSLLIAASTFNDNSAGIAGGVVRGVAGTITVRSSILAGSPTGGNCSLIGGTFVTDGYNLSDDESCNLTLGTDQQGSGVTINLGALQDNGGPTHTMLPESGSDALDAIPPADCATLSSPSGQRGVPRPQDDCEIGSVELGQVPVQIITTYNLGPVFQNQPVAVVVVAYGPAETPLTYEFDCDDDGEYEISQIDEPRAECTFTESGNHLVPVQVTDGVTTAGDVTTVEVLTAVPSITALDLTPAPSDEGELVELTATFTNLNPSATHSCEINWGDGTVEEGMVTETAGSGACEGSHTYADDDVYTVTVAVCNGELCEQASTTHTVNNVPPTVGTPQVNPSPSDEGEDVTASATFSDPGVEDTHTCTVDYGDSSGPQEGTVDQDAQTCTGPEHTYADDHPDGYEVTIVVCDSDGDCGQASLIHTVLNLPPVIHEILVSEADLGDPVTVTVIASDPGVNDVLSYEFDCDGSGDYEVEPQPGNSTVCPGDATSLTRVIGVRVSDGDGGEATDSVTLHFTATYCANPYTGQLSLRPNGCMGSEQAVELTSESAVSFCANPSTGQLRYLAAGCPSGWPGYVVPGAEPLAVCVNIYTGAMRVSPTGNCTAHEQLHIIPAV